MDAKPKCLGRHGMSCHESKQRMLHRDETNQVQNNIRWPKLNDHEIQLFRADSTIEISQSMDTEWL
jgi:hypothetical protein